MIRRPPRSTLDRSSAASDVYKRQRRQNGQFVGGVFALHGHPDTLLRQRLFRPVGEIAVSYTHLRAHETVLDLVCRLLLEKKQKKEKIHTKKQKNKSKSTHNANQTRQTIEHKTKKTQWNDDTLIKQLALTNIV